MSSQNIMFQSYILDYRAVANLGLPHTREPEPRSDIQLPPDTVIVSPDTHYSLDQDIFFERFPDHLKHRAPRVWRDERGVCQVGFDGEGLNDFIGEVFSSFEVIPGAYDMQARIADMDAEGVDKELAFPSALLVAMFHPDLEAREWVVRIYNEHLANLQEKAPGRTYGVGLINYWDMDKTAASVAELKALGLKTFMLPINPGLDKDGNKIFYHSDAWMPMWAAIEDSGLPVCFHIGENVSEGAYSQAAISLLMNLSPFRRVCGELIFGGILDRHPKLKIAFIEAGINWVSGMLQDAELIQASFHLISNWKLQKDIRSYWNDHMYASFMTDPLGLKQLDIIGVDNVMWSSDYPHPESTLGYTWTAMNEVLKATSPDDARKILGGNALKLFDLG